MAVPVVASSATAIDGDGTSITQITVSKPSGVVPGDVLYIIASHDSATGTTIYNTPAGWTLEDEIHGSGAGCAVYLFSRRADGSEGASITLSTAGTAGRAMNAVYLRVTGVDAGVSDLTHQYAEAENASSASQTSPAIITTEADCLTLSAFVTDNAAADNMAPAGGETEIADIQNPLLNGMVLGVYRLNKATPGSVSHSVTLNGAAPALALTWAINSGVAGGPTGLAKRVPMKGA